MPHADAWFDGACSGNPGPMGAGAVVVLADGTKRTASRPLGRGTNNEAEYEAVLTALTLAHDMGATTLTLHGDSQLILRQLEGRYAVKAANLQGLHAEARKRAARFAKVSYVWVPRDQNGEADGLARLGAEKSRGR